MKLSKSTLGLSIALACTGMAPMQATANTELPNIIVILADDLGYNDVGFTGKTEIQTPNVDRLAKEGAIFNNGYVTHSYCGPSRAALLTGRYQARFGMENNIHYAPYDPHMGLPLSETLFVEHLQQAGYRTGMMGKWHMGGALHFQPQNRGFDYFYGFLGGGHNYWPDAVAVGHPNSYWEPMVENGKPVEFHEYLTTALSRKASDFIGETAGEQPFLMYVSYNAPHAPLQAPKEDIAKYQHIEDKNRRTYAAMVDSMDQGIGMIMDKLEETDQFDNTLIFFLSDNGGVFPEAWLPNSDWADNTPFRRGKVALLEGGVHVPFIAHWPKGFEGGIEFDGLVSALDIAATSLDIAGVDTSDLPLEGKNLIPYLNGEKQGSPHAALFWRFEEGDDIWSVRTPEYKFMSQGFPATDRGRGDAGISGRSLFNMIDDPYESTNLAGKDAQLEKELAAMWNTWNEGNIRNVLEQSHHYKKSVGDWYDRHYAERRKMAENRAPFKID
ncbi:sulfatase family protein [Vibrio sp. WXL210]|uniref:sulfatase family protein n=1 Tax=Vibrio sp. WXL210 TaxID=3450709 RepID=UPI003EC7F0B7